MKPPKKFHNIRHDIHAEDYLANLRQLHNQINKPPTWAEQFWDLVLVILLLILFTSPIWIPAFGITGN